MVDVERTHQSVELRPAQSFRRSDAPLALLQLRECYKRVLTYTQELVLILIETFLSGLNSNCISKNYDDDWSLPKFD